MLMQNHRVDTSLLDDNNNTPLHVAAFRGKDEVALCLINEFGCNPNSKGHFGRSVLHCACQGGSISLVLSLIQKHGANINALDDERNTPLCLACLYGKPEIAVCLIEEFGCDPNVRGHKNRTLLHFACCAGSLQLVQTLIQKYNAGMHINSRDDYNDTPFHDAALSGTAEVLEYLISIFGCDSNAKGDLGKSLLHHACLGGNLAVVKTLIQDYQADVNAKDDLNDTPLFNAAEDGNAEVVLWLIENFDWDLRAQGHCGKTLLHFACQGGNYALVQTLIQEYKADVHAQDVSSLTPLQIAALFGRTEVALFLISECGGDVHAKGYLGRSLLHDACEGGSLFLVQYLLSKLSVLLVDSEGNTPLHTCSSHGQTLCVEALLSVNAPPLIRNNTGQTPVDVAKGKAKIVLKEYLSKNHHKLQVDYNDMLRLARVRYSGEYPVTRLFVLGYPEAGKSSLVESFKAEGPFQSFWGKISESSVTPHTPGIIPSVYLNRHYGRVLFYDFAGDPEYYSSHAAILENLASSKTGKNLVIIVVDLRDSEMTIKNSLQYWVLFISLQRFATKLSFALVGSHSDLIQSDCIAQKRGILEQFAKTIPLSAGVRCFMVDCRKPRDMTGFQKHISTMMNHTSKCKLSENARLLLGLLEKDFKRVTACSIQTILSHIWEYGLCLPHEPRDLYLTLSELHDIGVLLLLGDPTDGNCHLVLNIPKLTKDVHQSLFSKSAIGKLHEKFIGSASTAYNVGILPDSVLKEVLPPYITKQCLNYLQYCQEIRCEYIGVFVPELAQSDSSFLFFPALCSLSKDDISRVMPPNFGYSIGWLAQCTAHNHYFPSRFLHILLLRLVFRFTLSTPTQNLAPNATPDHSCLKRCCTMWKTGVHWLMEEGVECQVELVNGSKSVVVITRSNTDRQENCVRVFSDVISCVIETKEEFCHSIQLSIFLLDSTDEVEYLNNDNLYAMKEVEKALTQPSGKDVILSVSGKAYMERSKVLCLRIFSHWNSLFPMDFNTTLDLLKNIVRDFYQLGCCLGIPRGILDAIEVDFPFDTSRRRREIVRAWLNSTTHPPCWWHLVVALRQIEERVLAEHVHRNNSVVINLQEKLLKPQYQDLKPDVVFLESFAGVVGSKWPSLAVSLSVRGDKIEDMRKKGSSCQQNALHMLQDWVSTNEATYGQLCERLLSFRSGMQLPAMHLLDQ